MPESASTISQFDRLLHRAQAGSNKALGEILQGCSQYLLLVTQQRLTPELARKVGASDVVQDTFISAGKHFASFSGSTEQELLAWLRQILIHHLADARRCFIGTQKRSLNREISLTARDFDGSSMELMDPQGETPSRHAVRNETAVLLRQAIDELPPRYRTLIHLRHREHLPFEKIGERLGLSSDAARQLWARTITKLRKRL